MGTEQTREARIKTLTQTQLVRKLETLEKVNFAIERLQKLGVKVNFRTVAREASVSVQYLYKYSDLKERIHNIRTQQTQISSVPVNQPHVTAKAHSQFVSRLKQRIQQLELENNELKRKNEALAGQVYRVHSLQEQVERQKDMIGSLESRLKQTIEAFQQSKVVPLTSPSKSQISEQVLIQLEAVGIRLNSTLSKIIKSSSEEKVLDAINAYKEALATGNIERPGGWLKKAIQFGWKPNDSVQAKSELEIFNQWFPLASNKGLVMASQQTQNGIVVFTNHGDWISFVEMLSKYPLETL